MRTAAGWLIGMAILALAAFGPMLLAVGWALGLSTLLP